MSLADGEYDIDLSALIETPSVSGNPDENVAVRYGFIPDSMDHTKPLTLYQNEQECLLRASSTDGSDIVFEGIPQRHKPSTSNVANDSFYFSYVPKKGDSSSVQLKRLSTSIRFNKSRNVAKLQQKMAQWDKEYSRRSTTASTNATSTTSSSTTSSTSITSSYSGITATSSKPLKSSRPSPNIGAKTSPSKSTASSRMSTPPYRPKSSASKRPPTANNTPVIEAPDSIITESDFEDLDNDFDLSSKSTDFPIIVLNDDATPVEPAAKDIKPKSKPEETKPRPAVREKRKPTAQKTTSAPKPAIVEKADESMDLMDDFKDLEDQLQEVLEEEEEETSAPPPAFKDQRAKPLSKSISIGSLNDSDESDADDYQFPGIRIEEEVAVEKHTKFNDFKPDSSSNQKPMSLRDLIGGKKTSPDDDLSSSEEE
ncbi:predicted protein [Scheffersomyces stipitis CBS 6054]|uniref:Transcription elongation factor Eaf N-terminal domain-containing protein n=1 Tax=Scheffersomyces stipitis (strain ATCC 58785 / CBS 6054 / NBRC 10063 / NRRL Y-11545) TaxID=322104 RepID=A3GI63_PICST|nr:predicted protein [Scheffersomyces stipitis CBS 6054]EAZ62932.2 predicted protein [Scheffersomyces stipitis CBS 6054]